MAREVVIRTTDDLDRTQEASVTETLGFRGFLYELDLTDEHAEELAADLKKWLEAAHEKRRWPKKALKEAIKQADASKAPRKPRPRSTLTREQRKEARVWGRANGFTVHDRGYLSPDLEKAWRKATRSGRA
ncbi:Lsr2-like DNA bridging protein [Mycobacterium phage Nanosmite]|nr:Lsr2-like DNA bridging protein [Mycobacterium phage Nanosmite]